MISTIYRSIADLESQNIYELLYNRDIEIHYEPIMLTQKRHSMILNWNGRTAIFIAPVADVRFAEFLLWHEFWHYILHYSPGMKMNYYLSTRNVAIEYQANVFATIGIMRHVNLYGVDPVQSATSRGIPLEIARDVMKTIFDQDFTNYIFRR